MGKLFKHHTFLLVVVTVQESFVALIPFFFIISFLILLNYLFCIFNFNFAFLNQENLTFIINILKKYSSILATVSISFFLAKRLKVSQVVSIILSLAIFITVIIYENITEGFYITMGFSPIAILIPLFAVAILKLFYPYLSLKIPLKDGNRHVYRLFNYFLAFLVTYALIVIIYIILDNIIDNFIEWLKGELSNLPTIFLTVIRDFIIQIFWFFGINGNHIIDAIFGKTILFREIVPNLTVGEFNRLFVNIGGAGSGLALLLALLFYSKDKVVKLIGKISIPFVIFNINTLVLYSIVVLNRFIFLPFVFIPLFNLTVGYLIITTFNINFKSQYIVWTLPVFFNTYIKTLEVNTILLTQIFIIVINFLIYAIYIKRLNKIQPDYSLIRVLEKNLDIKTQLIAEENIQAYGAYKEIIEANAKLTKIIDMLNVHNLYVYYQPKVDILKKECNNFEALIRYQGNGKIKGPIFLDDIEKAGLAPVIDIWVVKRVKQDIIKWKSSNFFPKISINLHPDTLKSNLAINEILDILDRENVIFEIIERSFINSKEALKNFQKIQKKGFKVSIDDFGIGYSSLEMVVKQDIDEIKIDKALIDNLKTKKGKIVVKLIYQMTKSINCNLVAEGVEDKEQLDILKEIGVKNIQGYYFSPAISFIEVESFSKNIKSLF